MKRTLLVLMPLMLAACANIPKIHSEKFAKPQKVAIAEGPAMRNAALIGIVGYVPNFHFTKDSDYFFLVDPNKNPAGEPFPTGNAGMNAANSVANNAINTPQAYGGGNVGMQVGAALFVGGLIDASAASTQRKAEGFHQAVTQKFPNLDMRAEFSAALEDSLKSKGIQTIIVKDSINAPSRLRWPVGEADADTKALPIAAGDLPAVDADLLIQISPVAIYMAPGPLNNYRVRATVGVAIYNGRTKEYLGHQAFQFDPDAWKNEYISYDGLAKNIDKVVPAVREGLLSLIPAIASVISKESKPG